MARALSSEEEPLPSHGDPDRKRVLNVLAQRRYRQRRRQRMAELEAQAKATASPASTSSYNGASSSDQEGTSPPTSGGVSITQDAPCLQAFQMPVPPVAATFNAAFEQLPDCFGDVTFMDTSLPWESVAPPDINEFPEQGQDSSLVALTSDRNAAPTAIVDPLSLMQNPEVPLMKMMAVSLHVASLLGCSATLWDNNFRWTLDPLMCTALPSAFQPTKEQLNIPHHPLMDLIPFPSTRSKLICVFAMPPHLRPPNATGELGLMGIVHDFEDPVEGLRASGGDGYREEDWEVGEAFAKHWWWALDRDTIKRSNEMRMRRGARRLLESAD